MGLSFVHYKMEEEASHNQAATIAVLFLHHPLGSAEIPKVSRHLMDRKCAILVPHSKEESFRLLLLWIFHCISLLIMYVPSSNIDMQKKKKDIEILKEISS